MTLAAAAEAAAALDPLLDHPDLTFERTVPRAMVDRGDPTTVLITGWAREDNSLAVAACWPRLGGYYSLLDRGTHDPLLVLETFRQAALLLAHVVQDVPLATMQVMRSFHVGTELAALRMTEQPTEVRLLANITGTARGAIIQTDLTGEMYRGDTLVGRCLGKAVIPPEEMYLRVRGRDPKEVDLTRRLLPAVEPRTVGRESERDVVVSPGAAPGSYRMRIDTEHPNFFDNPTDHTPGMLLTEMMRQAVIAESGDPYLVPVSADIRFQRFVELDAPGEVLVRRQGDEYRSEILQFGKRTTHAVWRTDTTNGSGRA
jgi:hypothetical protein